MGGAFDKLRTDIKQKTDAKTVDKLLVNVKGDIFGTECTDHIKDTKTQKTGHCMVYYNKRMHQLPRVLYELFCSDIPCGMHVRHKCNSNGRCCTLKHLDIGTVSDNMQDTIRMGNGNTQKLTESDAREIIVSNLPIKQLAAQYNVTECTITNVKIGRTFAWIHRSNGLKTFLSTDETSDATTCLSCGLKLADVARRFGATVQCISKIKMNCERRKRRQQKLPARRKKVADFAVSIERGVALGLNAAAVARYAGCNDKMVRRYLLKQKQ